MIRIVRGSLKEYGEAGWTWQIQETNNVLEETKTATYRTNREGDGLWVCGSYEGQWAGNYEDKQIRGTSQFTVSKDYERARRQIRRYFVRQAAY